MITYQSIAVNGHQVFYREAGDPAHPTLLLLHGFPTSSHMFRDLIPLLADRYHLVAPDLPGFGQTKSPPRGEFAYTFDGLAHVIEGFTEALGLSHYAIYVFDYGAPTGFRLAVAHPERVTAIISQNGNAYLEGLSAAWEPWQTYWREPTPEHREACRDALSPAVIRDVQYLHGADPKRVSPDGYTLDLAYMARSGSDENQLDLVLDYRSNVALYPKFQEYFRVHQPPFLAVWGKNDPFFLPAGAEAFKRDLPDASINFLDTGHFALETHAAEIARLMRDFLGKALGRLANGQTASIRAVENKSEDLIHLESHFGPRETMERLEAAIRANGMQVFARIDHAAGAAAVGLELRPTEVIIFGNARGGTPLMQMKSVLGLDLPLKALVWQDAADKTWLTYLPPAALALRHGLGSEADPIVGRMAAMFENIAGKAVNPAL